MDLATINHTITQPDLFIFAGEPSGDLHGESLLQSLYSQHPDIQITGVGGPRMRQYPFHCILLMEEFQVMGFIDVFFALPKLLRHFYFLLTQILKTNPKVVVFIDYPGFALRMEKKLKKKGFTGKIIHYICPSVWAWGKKRIPLIEQNVDLLLSLFPFEKKYFSPSFPIAYIGHPLISRLKEHSYQKLEWAEGKKIISLFPGSRKKEILRNFPLQLKTLKTLLEQDSSLIGAISLSQQEFLPLLSSFMKQENLAFGDRIHSVPVSQSYELMQHSFLALAKSGTVTLELALHKVPTVVLYVISPLDLFLAKKIFRISLPFYCIVNIVANKEVFVELIGRNATEENLLKEAKRLLIDTPYRNKQKDLCQKVNNDLNEGNTSEKAAQHILSFL